ncbi:MAG: LysM peptidoglycan-binding domain-containing protein [Spirochaetales bacterium]|nr:LysM peptidoglycan-binding domain-containing protein [Spirochaetales bacterium]
MKTGDTFYGIALIYDVPVELLLTHNGLEEGSVLRVDQVLKIPGTYEVKPGDTYYGISRTVGVSLAELLEYNDRTESTILLAGETLQIPVSDDHIVSAPVPVPPDPPSGEPGGSGTEGPGTSPSGPKDGPDSYFWPHPGSRSKLTGKLKGEQFSGNPGDPVFSVSTGDVIWVAPYRGYNKLIIVKSADTHVYAYGGNDLCLVNVGDSVFPGMEIGRLGVNPHEGQAKAFFFVYKDGEPVDPGKAPRL